MNYEIQKARSENQLIAGIVLTGGGAMMKHIQMLAEFSTGLEVRIGYPNEHLTQGTPKEMASPMYSTGIGIVIETIARMEHDEHLRASQEAKKAKAGAFHQPEIITPKPFEQVVEEEEVLEEEEKGNFGIGKKIITRLSNLLKPDDIN